MNLCFCQSLQNLHLRLAQNREFEYLKEVRHLRVLCINCADVFGSDAIEFLQNSASTLEQLDLQFLAWPPDPPLLPIFPSMKEVILNSPGHYLDRFKTSLVPPNLHCLELFSPWMVERCPPVSLKWLEAHPIARLKLVWVNYSELPRLPLLANLTMTNIGPFANPVWQTLDWRGVKVKVPKTVKDLTFLDSIIP